MNYTLKSVEIPFVKKQTTNCKMKSNFHTLIAIHVFKQIKTNSDCSSPFKEEQGTDNTKYVN